MRSFAVSVRGDGGVGAEGDGGATAAAADVLVGVKVGCHKDGIYMFMCTAHGHDGEQNDSYRVHHSA